MFFLATSEPVLFHSRSLEDSSGLVESFLPFHLRIGVSDNSGADVEMECFAFQNCCTDGDVETGFPVESKTSDRSRVEAAVCCLQFFDDFPGPLFRGSGDAPAGKAGSQRFDRIDLRAQGSFHGGDEMENLRKSFELEQFRGFDGPELADLTEVVALQISDHDELSEFL